MLDFLFFSLLILIGLIFVITIILYKNTAKKQNYSIKEKFKLNYFKLSYKQKTIRTLNILFYEILIILIMYIININILIIIFVEILILITFIFQFFYNFNMWKKNN